MRKYKTLESWISEALTNSEKDGICSALTCVYNKPHQGGTKEVHTVKLIGKTWEPAKLAELFKGKAETFAQDLGGIQTFELQAFYGASETQATHTFTIVDGEIRAGGQERGVKETPDGPGIVAQSMRHAEKFAELTTNLIQQISVTSVQREIQSHEREHQLQTEVSDAYNIIRDMLMKQVTAQHELVMQRLQYERSTAERKKFLELAPALANTVAGREIFPQSVADTSIIETLATKIKPEALEMLVKSGLLPPELAGTLSVRFEEVLEKKKKESEELKKLPPSNIDPEKDAAGESTQTH